MIQYASAVKSGVTSHKMEEVRELLDEVIRWFEEVTEAVRLRRDHIHRHGLE